MVPEGPIHVQHLDARLFHLSVLRPAAEASQLGREMRKALGESLATLTVPQLQRLEMNQQARLFICNHSLDCGDLCSEDGVDLLNVALYDLSQRTLLRRLSLKGFPCLQRVIYG